MCKPLQVLNALLLWISYLLSRILLFPAWLLMYTMDVTRSPQATIAFLTPVEQVRNYADTAYTSAQQRRLSGLSQLRCLANGAERNKSQVGHLHTAVGLMWCPEELIG